MTRAWTARVLSKAFRSSHIDNKTMCASTGKEFPTRKSQSDSKKPKPHPKNNASDSSTALGHSHCNLKRSNSQVFDTTEPELDGEMARANVSVRRKSSWAFWRPNLEPEHQKEGNNEAQPPATSEPPNPDLEPAGEVESVVINNVNIKPNRSSSMSSWAFWSSTVQQNNNSQPDDNFNGSKMMPPPDVVKSDVSKHGSNEAKRIASKLKNKPSVKNLDKRSSIVIPKLQDTLPVSSTYSLCLNSYKRVQHLLGYTDLKDSSLFRKNQATTVKRVLIIGVHGFYPTKMIRPIIGEPTGTSMKFAQVGESAMLSWAEENGLQVEIQKIALEKEGKIFDRVDFFFDILKNSAEDIQKADFIFICAHSQGTPVSIMLISKLLEYGIIGKNKHIAILGMAGINIGPFYGMDKSLFVRAYSAIENESLLELFQFQNFESLQSRKYIDSLKNLVKNNVKVTFIGSIDDQLVPLYSAIALHVQHPNFFRGVYIDHSTNTPDFVARIIKLSCMLYNLGSTDHDVIKEISTALAGPITGGGHSKIYNDLQVYKLALDFTLKTESSTISVNQPVRVKPFDIKKLGTGANPFNLPWCARGLFFEVNKRVPNGKQEIESVFKEFDDWSPDSKALKDIKYRLNGIKAKL